MKKDTITEEQAKKSPSGGVLVGKREGQTIIHDKGTQGGYFVGKLHKEGGIQGINKSTGQPIEVQGGEVIITAPAVADQTKREFEGEMLTNREILSKINERGGGVSLENGGEIYYNGSSYNYGGKTMTDYEIMQSMNDCICEHEYNNGGQLDLVEESEKGDHPARDFTNYTDVLDIQADGIAGAENGLLFEDGGFMADVYENGGATLSAEVLEWDKVPSNYRNISKVKKVLFTNNPMDKGLDSIISTFLGKDLTNPKFTGINFDKNGITATDTHKLITLPYPSDIYNGIYDINKAKKEKSKELILINENYPNYQGIIPSSDVVEPFKINVYKLLQYTKTALNYCNKETNAIIYKIDDNRKISFNGKFLLEVLNSSLKLGNEILYAFIPSSDRAMILSPNKKYELGNDEIFLIMPIKLIKTNEYLGAKDINNNRSIEAYFDFNDSEIHNADGSVAEFKMQYENNLSIDEKYLALLSKITSKNTPLPILNYAKVENGKMTASNLETDLIIKDVDIPSGIYQIINKSANITNEDILDFPKERVYDKNEYYTIRTAEKIYSYFEFKVSNKTFSFYLDKLLLSIGKDSLRPAMSGILIKKTSDNEMFLVTTNANTLCKINITDYCDFEKDDRELEYILPVEYLKDFTKLTEGNLLFRCSLSNIFIEANNLEYITRVIDAKYPKYEGVIPKDNTKKIVFNRDLMNKCLKSKEYLSTIEKYKGQKDIYFVILNNANRLILRVSRQVKYNEPNKFIEDVDLCSIDFNYEETEKSFSYKDSLFLLMPVMGTPEQNTNFIFGKDLFEVMLKTMNDDNITAYFSEFNRAYLFPIEQIESIEEMPKKEVEKENQSKKEYEYVLTVRPFDIGTYPKDNFLRFEQQDYQYGVVIYSEPISIREIEHYSLCPITEIKDFDGKFLFYIFSDTKQKIRIKLIKDQRKGYFVNIYYYDNDGIESTEMMSAVNFLKKVNDGDYKLENEIKNESKKENSEITIGYFKVDSENTGFEYAKKINDYFNKWNKIKTLKDKLDFEKLEVPMFGSFENESVLNQIETFEKLGFEFGANEVVRNDFKKEVKKIIDKKIFDREMQKKYGKEDEPVIENEKSFEGEGSKEGKGKLYEFFTPQMVADKMLALAQHYGFKGGNVLEPASGNGRLLKHLKDTNITAFEISKENFEILKKEFPNADLHNYNFEKAFLKQPRFNTLINKKGTETWLKTPKFDLVLANPPYGKFSGLYSSYFNFKGQVEHFFILQTLHLLKKGGLGVYLIPSSFLRNGITYNKVKKEIFEIAELVDAYRLPSNIFAKTQIGTDILILRKK